MNFHRMRKKPTHTQQCSRQHRLIYPSQYWTKINTYNALRMHTWLCLIVCALCTHTSTLRGLVLVLLLLHVQRSYDSLLCRASLNIFLKIMCACYFFNSFISISVKWNDFVAQVQEHISCTPFRFPFFHHSILIYGRRSILLKRNTF